MAKLPVRCGVFLLGGNATPKYIKGTPWNPFF